MIRCYWIEPTGAWDWETEDGTIIRTESRDEAPEEWEVGRPIYRRADTGEELSLKDCPPGAMWDQAELGTYFADRAGPDGLFVYVKLPDGHHWAVDGRANNCGLPDDDDHRCWVRHGEVPNLTVDKNGETCDAGAGSIQTPGWHGFLRAGELVET